MIILYNRYIPQADGTFQRSRVQEHRKDAQVPPLKHSEEFSSCQQPTPTPPLISPAKQASQRQDSNGIEGFLRQLLPKDFDTGDLLVILLLLLMAGDGKDHQNTALLTLALYLFM